MAIKPQNVVTALKDKKVTKFIQLTNGEATNGGTGLFNFVDYDHDYEVVSIIVLVTKVTQAAAAPFSIGFSAYTDKNGASQVANATAFLTTALCKDNTGASFSNGILAAGSKHVMTPPYPSGTMKAILPRGASLTITGSSASNSGEALVTVTLRPKELPFGNASKRPGASADHSV